MELKHACENVLVQLFNAVECTDQEDYTKAVDTLNGSTIGEHVRHTLEFFVCLREGFETGIVNYDNRKRDFTIQSNKTSALELIKEIIFFIRQNSEERKMELEVGYSQTSGDFLSIGSSFFREIAYNIEHAVHHMALIKVGVREVCPYVELPEEFGLAVSTFRHMHPS